MSIIGIVEGKRASIAEMQDKRASGQPENL